QMFSANPQGGLQQIQQGTAIEPLTRLGDDGRPRPALAEGWDLTPDRRSLTLRLRSGVKFHDGSPVTAATVADILNKTLPKTMGPAFEDVVSIRPINETAIDIQFRAPAPFLLESLEVTIQKPGSAQIGTGPYQPAGPEAPNEVRAYRDYDLGAPTIDRIVVNSYPTVRAAWADML